MSRKTADTQALDRYVGHQVRWYRVQRGLSQNELADKLGISYQQLHKYENGANSVSASRLADIAVILRTDIMEFFSGYSEETMSAHDDGPNREQLLLAKYYNQITQQKDRAAVMNLIKSFQDL